MRRRSVAGLTAIEMTLIVSIAAVLLAVFVPTFLKQVRLSKTSEPTLELAEIDARARVYYQALHGGAARRRRCLPAPAGPTPSVGSVDPIAVDFHADDGSGNPTWQALDYQPSGPIRFRYSFTPVAARCGVHGAHLWTIVAEGDLDGDGKHSSFERSSGVVANGTVGPTGVFHILDRVE